MQLKTFILILSAIVMLFSGICIFVGSRKKERRITFFYLLSMIIATIFTVLILIFMNFPPTDKDSFEAISAPAYFGFVIFFMVSSVLMILGTVLRIKNYRSRSAKISLILLTATSAVLRILTVAFCLFSLIYPAYFAYIWAAPIALALMAIIDYYAVLKYRVIELSSKSLKLLSYVIIIATAGVVYMLIFYAIITFLFKIQGLSTEIYILTFIMVTILLLILPVMSEVLYFIRSLVLKDQFYLGFILKKLNKMSGHTDADEIADFLAGNLHFSYVGIVIGEKVHGPKKEQFTASELEKINQLAEPERGVWQDIDPDTKKILDDHNIKAVAAMFDAKGNVFGQILVGSPSGKAGFEKRDLAQLETIINIVSAMIDSRA